MLLNTYVKAIPYWTTIKKTFEKNKKIYKETLSKYTRIRNSLDNVKYYLRKLNNNFRDFVVYRKQDFDVLFRTFHEEGYKSNPPPIFKIYPKRLKIFRIERYRELRFLKLKIGTKNELDSMYLEETNKINNTIQKMKKMYLDGLRRIYDFRNHLLFWVYNKEFEIVWYSNVLLKRYDFFSNVCEEYWRPYKMIKRKCLGIEFFLKTLFKNEPVYSYETNKYLWLPQTTKYIDFVLVAEPKFDNRYFILKNRVEKLYLFMDFENNLLRLAKKEKNQKSMVNIKIKKI